MTEVRKSGKSKKPKGTILCSSTTRYLVKERIGEGGFSSVVRAVNLSTSEEVAIKILKDKQDAKKEYAMLKVLKVLDPEKNNLVHFIEKFRYNGQTCLVFEKLDMDLHSMNEMLGRGMTLHEIRPIAHQLVTTLKALKSIGVVHSDIKPDNVMVVDPHATPVRVKLIDFGLSSNIPSELGELCQPLGYRAPEVSLGLPFSEAIDMWGLACVLLFLYLNAHPFPSCEYQTVKAVVGLLGLPADHLLKAGMYTDMFFKEDQYWSKPGWWLKISEEFYSKKNKTEKVLFKTLDDLITLYPLSEGSMELSDRRAFFSLIKGLLEMDPDRRLTPEKALSHPFLTMSHILEQEEPYLFNSLDKMGNLGMEEDDSQSFKCDMAQEEPEEEKPKEDEHKEDEPEEKASAFGKKHRTRADKSASTVSVSAVGNKHRTRADKSASAVSAFSSYRLHTRAEKKINDRSRTVTVEKPLKKDKKSFCRIVKKAFIKILKKIKKIGRR